jgi:hypothetical protein
MLKLRRSEGWMPRSAHCYMRRSSNKKQYQLTHASLRSASLPHAALDCHPYQMQRAATLSPSFGARLAASLGNAVVGPTRHAAACESWREAIGLPGAARGRRLPASVRDRCLLALSRSH